MTDKVVAEFTAKGVRYQLIAESDGWKSWTVFTRVLDNWDLDDIDIYTTKEKALARFLYLVNNCILGS